MYSKKKILFLLVFVVGCILVLTNIELIGYGLSQARGQLRIVREARPISDVLEDLEFPDSLKTNLRKIGLIKSFAFDSLGINYSENYSSVYNQKGRPSMFVVTACDPFQLNPKKWHFPILGSFSYKGFFEIDKARKLEEELKEDGYDTNIRIAGGWSHWDGLKIRFYPIC